jgi:hypothetical protein
MVQGVVEEDEEEDDEDDEEEEEYGECIVENDEDNLLEWIGRLRVIVG